MVRHKKRWLLVQLEFQPPSSLDNTTNKSTSNTTVLKDQKKINGRDLHRQLRNTFLSCFGVAGSAAAIRDTQVRWTDMANTRLALIRCSREWSGQVRAALTFCNNLPIQKSLQQQQQQSQSQQQQQQRGGGGGGSGNSNNKLLVIASVLSVHGSARTAKLGAMARVRSHFRQQRLERTRHRRRRRQAQKNEESFRIVQQEDHSSIEATDEADCQRLESLLREIDQMDVDQHHRFKKDESNPSTTADDASEEEENE